MKDTSETNIALSRASSASVQFSNRYARWLKLDCACAWRESHINWISWDEQTKQKFRIIDEQESLFIVDVDDYRLMMRHKNLMNSYVEMTLVLEHDEHALKIFRALCWRLKLSSERWMRLSKSESVRISVSRETSSISYTLSYQKQQINVASKTLTSFSDALLKRRWKCSEKKYCLFIFNRLLEACVVDLWRYVKTILSFMYTYWRSIWIDRWSDWAEVIRKSSLLTIRLFLARF